MQSFSAIRQSITRPDRFVIVVLVTLLLVYGASLQNHFTGYDDTDFITKNSLVTDAWPGSILEAFMHTTAYLYIPLTLFSWQINAHLMGLDPFWFHGTDLLIHALNVFLIFWILRKLTNMEGASLIAALIFAVHPMNVEAVAWAASRKDILSAFFGLLSFASYINYRDTDDRKWFKWTFAFYLLGLFAKVAVIPLPLIFLAYDWYKGRPMLKKELWLEKLWFVPLMLAFGYFGAKAASPFIAPLGAKNFILLGAKATTTLLSLFFWPSPLNALRYQMTEPTLSDPSFLYPVILVSILAVLILLLMIFRKAKSFVFASLWIFLFLVPTFNSALKAGLLFVTSEKYFYLPMIGLLFLLIQAASFFINQSKMVKPILVAASVFVIVIFGLESAAYARAWSDGQTLYKEILQVDPTNSVAKGSLAFELNTVRQSDEAIRLLKESLTEDPYNAINYINLAGIYYAQGLSVEAEGALQAMIPNLEAREVQGDEGLRKALSAAADLLDRHGNQDLAIKMLQKGIQLDPNAPELNDALATRLLTLGKPDEAYPMFEKAAAAGSTDVNVYYHLVEYYSKNGRTADLKRVLQKAVELDPQNKKARQTLESMK